jgi:hypothetical protein
VGLARYSYTQPDDRTIGGLLSTYSASLLATPVSLKATGGRLYGWHVYNDGAAAVYLKFYDTATTPTVGTDTPLFVLGIPTKSAPPSCPPAGVQFASGIWVAAVTGAADGNTTAPSANQVVASFFSR